MRFGNGIFAIATLALYTRLLDPEEYGVYALGVAVTTIVSGVLFQWLSLVISRFYSLNSDDPSKVMGVVSFGFWVATALTALIYVSLFQFLLLYGLDYFAVFVLFLITIFMGIYILALQVANAQNRPILYCQLSWAKGLVSLVVGCILIYYGLGEGGALVGFWIGLMMAVITFSPQILLRLKLCSFDNQLAEKIFRYGIPLAISNLAITTVDVSDRFMIGSLLGVAQVASYAVSYDLVQQSVGSIMNFLFLAAFPLIVQSFDLAEDESTHNRLSTLGSNLLGIGLPVAAAVGFFAENISEFILGNDYSHQTARIIPWLAAAIFIGAFKSFYLDVVFQLRNATKYQGYIAVLMVTVNIVLNLILLPIYGVVAAAWTTLATFMIGALTSWILGRSFFTLPSLGKDFVLSSVATVSTVFVLHLLPSFSGLSWFLFMIAIYIVVYVLLAWIVNVAGLRSLYKI